MSVYYVVTPVIVKPPDQAQYVGESVTIACSASDPIWTKDGHSLPGDIIVEENELVIDQVTMEHTGSYMCNSTPTEEGEWSSGYSKLYVGGKNVALIYYWNQISIVNQFLPRTCMQEQELCDLGLCPFICVYII